MCPHSGLGHLMPGSPWTPLFGGLGGGYHLAGGGRGLEVDFENRETVFAPCVVLTVEMLSLVCASHQCLPPAAALPATRDASPLEP